jgi:plasmid stability protein
LVRRHVDRQNYSHYYPRRLQAEVLLDAIDLLCGSQTDFTNLPPGTRAVALPDNSYNATTPFLRVFGRPEAESVCECERVQSSSLTQNLHLLNAPDIRSKLSHAGGRAQRLAAEDRPVEEKVRELYRVAFSREPAPDELRAAVDYLAEIPVDASGNSHDPARASQENFQGPDHRQGIPLQPLRSR